MKKKIMAATVMAAAFAVCTPLTACDTAPKPSFVGYFSAMGNAIATLTVPQSQMDSAEFKALSDRVETLLTSTDSSISSTQSTSCIFAFNLAEAGTIVELDETAYEVLKLSKTVYEMTDGYFNPAVWYSEDLYGFTSYTADELADAPYAREISKDGNGNYYYPLPEDKYVTAFCQLASHFDELVLSQSDGKYYATKPDFTVSVEGDERVYSLRLDLGGIGKGWCADRVNEMLDEAGVEYGYFGFGDSSMALKKYDGNESRTYTVMARDPRAAGSSYVSLSLSDAALSTSGDHQQYYMIDGVRYCHIIDPTTGSPIQTGIASVTVVGGSAAEDDALTTAITAMGKQTAVQFINEKLADRTVVMLVFEDGVGTIITNRTDKVSAIGAYAVGNTVENGKIVLK